MEERFVPPLSAESRPIDAGDHEDVHNSAGGLHDPRALQILTTEHWSLLTARSLVYNETFARGGMFLAFLSATLLVLGLIATATGFSDAFLFVAAVVLALDLFIGLASLGRINAAGNEDIRYLQGMNRLRHAYHEMVPQLDRYFISGHHDDFDSVLAHYGPATMGGGGALAELLRGFTTMPGMISVICSAVSGALLAVVVLLLTHDPLVAAIAALSGSVLILALGSVAAMRAIAAFGTTFESKFPAPKAAEPTPKR